jgi:hypothetical protein
MNYQELRKKMLEAAKRCAARGPGYATQRIVLDEARSWFGDYYNLPPDLTTEQAILTCWHDLFRDGELAWGHNLDNPDAPFFHVREVHFNVPNRARGSAG